MDGSKEVNPFHTPSLPGDSSLFTETSSRCVYETILANHIQEERLRYDNALERADTVLRETRMLKERVGALAHDFHGLEKHFQNVISLNVRFRREVKERVEYLDNEAYLAGLIANLIAEHESKTLLDCPYSLVDLKHDSVPDCSAGRRMSRHKRRLLYRLLCAKGTHHDHSKSRH